MRRFFNWKTVLAGFVGVFALGAGAFVVIYHYVEIPEEGKAAARLQSNIYKSSDGRTIARIGEVNRQTVPLSRIPQSVQHAVVAAENKSFYTDPGVDLQGMARALLNTTLGRGKQGGSTITQQYVKNYYLDQRQTVSRKVKELFISLKMQDKLSKSQILQGYLNTSYFGRGAYGIQAASRAYYDKDVDQLNLQEGAYLAALLQSPSQYDWAAATETGKRSVKARWGYVLDNMVEQKWLSPGDRVTMRFEEPGDPKRTDGLKGQNGYLIEAAKQEMIRALIEDGRSQEEAERDFATGGWTITLTIDGEKQRDLEGAIKHKLLDDLNPRLREVDSDVQVGAASVDPKTGRIVALYGGRDYLKHYTDNATRRDYQPASTFKPVILASAFENDSATQSGRRIAPGTLYDGTDKRPVVGPGGHGYAPENEDGYSQNPITVQQGMNDSVNAVFAQMAVDVGLGKVKKTATDLGMKGEGTGFVASPAMALGSMGASPLDMVGVYATFAHHGKKVTPSIIASASRNGKKYALPDAVGGDSVVSRNTADGVTSVLRGVVDDGTANAVRSSRYQVAGKTGTSDDDKSAWFTGYTPDLVTSVGLFGEALGGQQVSLQNTGGHGRVNGGTYPARIWAEYTAKALGDDSTPRFSLETRDGAVPTAPITSAPASASPTPSQPAPMLSQPVPSQSQRAVPTPSFTAPPPVPVPSHTPTPTPVPTPTPSTSTGGTDKGGRDRRLDQPVR
ncbi:transglycosylase domain-containing protein [Streptomyces sp. AV19]|uniref:transglycosylase domain-containing protein n=1 Tax=Streptomyces sp. AV19 TaxID=2793068 RepID=UPI001F478A35|nr:transglycosylase domain-containing protein [Streptomyces sp. AV19]MDG4536938.1 penicillin-binding protein [Streptomyces sp. AV19]